MNEGIVIFAGEASASGKGAHVKYLFTTHVGGEFDACKINRGSAFELEYRGEREGMDLALMSHSGSTRYAQIKPDPIEDLGGGLYRGKVTYEAVKRAYGEEFSYLDELRPVADAESQMTLLKLTYLPGQGESVDDRSSRWRKPEEGIAFIGDSIVENVLLNCGDFNTLLGRRDCVNFGIGAQTSKHCLARIGELAGRHFRQLVIWCGINDLFWEYGIDEIVGRVQAMCEAMRRENPGIRFAIISVLPTTKLFFTDAQWKIAELNKRLKALCEKSEDMAFADAYPSFLAEDGYAREELTLDGLHPNDAGYELVAQALKPCLLEEK